MPLAIFDLDNTLIDRDGAFRRWADEFADTHGLDPEQRAWIAAADEGGFAARPAFLARLRERFRLDEPVDRLVDRYRDGMVARVAAYPDTPGTLARLRDGGWRVAIATNGDTTHQWAKIRIAGLAELVDAVAVSGEVGADKPDRRMFEAAARRAGTRLAGEDWMAGDCPARDIAGGYAAGLRTIWMRHGRTWDATGPAPDAIVDRIGEAVTVIAGLSYDRAPSSPPQQPS